MPMKLGTKIVEAKTVARIAIYMMFSPRVLAAGKPGCGTVPE